MRRVLTIILIAALIVAMSFTGSAAGSNVCFIAINETLLDLSVTPYFYGSAFVPYTVFGNLKIYSAYFPDSNTISLYRSDKQLYFNLSTGQTYDGNDNYYTTSTITQNGRVFVSVQFVCSFFGLSWSYINGIGYGDILRITDSGSYLSDTDFLYAATPKMQTRYESYINSLTPSSPSPSPEASPSPTPQPDDSHAGTVVQLSFEGIPGDAILNTLAKYAVNAVFYLTPEEIAANPDTVRRIAGSGHGVGIYCGSACDYDYYAANELLFDAAQIRSVMVSSSGETLGSCRTFASNYGLYFGDFSIDAADRTGLGLSYSAIVSRIEAAGDSVSVRFDCSQSTERVLGSILNYLKNNQDAVALEREA